MRFDGYDESIFSVEPQTVGVSVHVQRGVGAVKDCQAEGRNGQSAESEEGESAFSGDCVMVISCV